MNNELIIKGILGIQGVDVIHIEGGFGTDKKGLLAKNAADIHQQPLFKINERINTNRNRFKDGIDILDLKGNFDILLKDNEIMTQNAINKSNNIYLLSERGYSKLLKILEDDKSWEVYDMLMDQYFSLREEVRELKEDKKKKLTKGQQRIITGDSLFKPKSPLEATDHETIINNAYRQEVEYMLDKLYMKALYFINQTSINDSRFSSWRTGGTNLTEEELKEIAELLGRFKTALVS